MIRSRFLPSHARIFCCLLAISLIASGCGPAKVETPANTGDAPKAKFESPRTKTEL